MESTSNKKRFWDLYLIKNNGEWLGFRLPWASLQRLSTYFVFSLVVLSLCMVGWFFSRWKMLKMEEELQFLKLEKESIKHTSSLPLAQATTALEGADYSYFPSLEAKDYHSILVEAQNFKVVYKQNLKSLSVDFDLVRLPPRDGPKDFYWILLLHGSTGILSFPAALTSRAGEVLLYHRGYLVKELKGQISVQQQLPLSFFVEQSGTEPIYASLYLYDDKGSLLARYRQDLGIER